jgi:hypothetical protein
MLLGFYEVMQDRGTQANSLPACSQIITHLIDNDITKLTHDSIVHAWGVHVPQVSRTSMI